MVVHCCYSDDGRTIVLCSCVSGMIDVEELIKAFKELGVEVDKKEATKLLQRYFLYLDTFHSLRSLFPIGVDQVSISCNFYFALF